MHSRRQGRPQTRCLCRSSSRRPLSVMEERENNTGSPYRRRLVFRRQSTSAAIWIALAFAVVGGPVQPRPAKAQTATPACGAPSSSTSGTPFRVENAAAAITLNAAVNCSGGGPVEVVWAGAVTLDTPIVVGTGTVLSITGEDDSSEVLGGSSTRLFDVLSQGGLSLTNLKLSGGSAAAAGGAIRSFSGDIILQDCVFEGNAATEGDGGAVWAEGGNLTIVGGQFLDNSASVHGGAIKAMDTGVVIQEGTKFEGNTAIEGGALYCGSTGVTPVGVLASCSLTDVLFSSNNATSEDDVDFGDLSEDPWVDLYGGGAAAFMGAETVLTDCVFQGNYAQVAGGALYGGYGAGLTINGCTFSDNQTPGFGGGMCVSSVTLGGGTEMRGNSVDRNGGGVFGWDVGGEIVLNDIFSTGNTATNNGGGVYSNGGLLVNNGTVMVGDIGGNGGCLYCWRNCDMLVTGGRFTCEANDSGAFVYASAASRVNITDCLAVNNVAQRRAGAVYCSGSNDEEVANAAVFIEGGKFLNNRALELGGALAAWGTGLALTVTGGIFRNNTAKYDGGFVFVEEQASLSCEGAIVEGNHAGDQGGAIYAQDATWINSTCDLIGNEAPQGGAAFLTYMVERAEFENLDITDNVASGGSVIFVAYSAFVARGVTFESGVGLQEDSSNRAVQLDSASSMIAEDCVFSGWLGDTVVYGTNPHEGSLVLDNCDFRGSRADMAVISPYSDAEIRNAVIGENTVDNAVTKNGSLKLVDRALDCGDPNACGTGACVDSSLGVLCECLESGECLNGGGALSLSLQTPPATVTYNPDRVSFELLVSAAGDGTTYAIWDMSFEAEELALEVVPSSGVLPPGDNITVTVTGSPMHQDVGGELTSSFVVTSVGSGTTDSTAGVGLEVSSTFYFCGAFEYAEPTGDSAESVTCTQCAAIDGAEGVDCKNPGATRASLPIRPGYWRSSKEALVVHSCIHPEACVGATVVSSAEDYCDDGYKGPFCAVCSEGYGEGVSTSCHSCEDTRADILIAAGALFSLVLAVLLVLAIVFLVGGLDAVGSVRRSVALGISRSAKTAKLFRSGRGSQRGLSVDTTQQNSAGDSLAPALGADSVTGGFRRAPAGAGPGRTARVMSSDVGGADFRASRSPTSSVGIGVGLLPMGQPSSALPDGIYEDASGAEERDEQTGWRGLGERIKRWVSRLPFDKLKILVVVWQILTVFPTITAVDFPPSYSRFLSGIDFVNLDLGRVFSATCVLPSVGFYGKLLITTLTPIFLVCVLVVTYHLAKSRSGIGSAGVAARRAAWARHMAAGLLLSFLLFTSASTMVFKTFACDWSAVDGESYLRADYSVSCKTKTYTLFRIYAGLMILVYPIGIPLLYALILWKNRHSLNPSVRASAESDPDALEEEEAADDGRERGGKEKGTMVVGGHKSKVMSAEELEELDEMVKMRRANPDLVPSMFLWKDFGPDLYYYEVVECGRRILLTGVLIFIAPHTAAQAAMACIFAFGSLLGFELLRPHLDPTDSWLYRLGCVVIFLSNFLALLIKVDAAGDGKREALGALLVAVNVFLILAVLFTSWFATQQSVDEAREEDDAITMAKTILTAEKLAANSAGLSREKKEATRAASSPVPYGSFVGSSASVGPGAPSRKPQGSETDGITSDGTGLGKVKGSEEGGKRSRAGRVSAAAVEELWQRDKEQH